VIEKIRSPQAAPAVPERPRIAYIEGDGIGRDITPAMRLVVDAAVARAYGGARGIEWEEVLAGEKALERVGTYLPDETVMRIRELGLAIKGPLTTPVGGGFRSLNVTLRQVLDLYACVRPVRYIRGVPSPMREPEKVDVIIFRENIEDVYAGIEFAAGSPEAERLIAMLKEMRRTVFPGSAIGIKPMSKERSQRLVRLAIRHALERGRRVVTMVHKGNIQKFTEGAFRAWGYELARAEFAGQVVSEEELGSAAPEGRVLLNDRIADSMFQQLLLRPADYQVLATPNLNGDYLSDAAAAQVGGLGMAPGANLGEGVAVFEATHGSAPKHAGQDKANPGSLLLSAAMMLEHIGWPEASRAIAEALERTILERRVTYDLARLLGDVKPLRTSEFAAAIVANL
jgi:isocitrate dehydrogenase